MHSAYEPISCELHSALELAAMRRRPARLHMVDGSWQDGIILDVWTAQGREWLCLRRADGDVEIDLTHIQQVQENTAS
ncbi:transcriptional antiterminator, Rof [Acidithiobacillus sp. 'AMD consortium']|uniref:Transcriptional antiterminator, Rof n=3 Tax=Acidithiobacillus ferridurans TaxID=1232575 RepID=A0A8X8KC33_ACIFI|nr:MULTISPECIES: Rho-binding antiterminator [Acidithiobacillus]MBU2717489.1 transcriptional antiterminator, Rof [Acidithiobacillus ferridurans]MBU2721048.1 transcriptional antiterminator, Rof [Acidithiobacillus ferridurans]MBU2723818.1 transcriptional antiterminator, Rof [Acidithiobacillus ferridurans]MBU2727245.1 transcriptional antiterminator, Rof [Acidithiobacillus ferridurans]MBU2731577.1 transcriptional antiterminator, Rof [Acidithiobacillus ferridurans]